MSGITASQTNLEMCFTQNPHFPRKKWLNDFRLQQFKQFLHAGFPARKDELWKYTEIKENLIPEKMGILCEPLYSEKFSAATAISNIVFVFINGHFAEKLSNTQALPPQVTLCMISQALETHEDKIKPYLLREFDVKRFPFAKLNAGMMTNGMFLEIPKNITVTTPIHLLFINTKQHEFMTNPRNIIIAGQHSNVTIIEDHFAENAQHYFTNAVTDIHAAENARVNYYKIQDDHLSATHIANVLVEQKQDSCVKTVFLSKGARLEREDLSIWQQERGAETDMHGLYVLRHDQQHVDHHVHVDHLAANGTSSMLYKGILEKKSHAVFNGKVYVHPATKQINAHQANHNLLLSTEAEVNSKPELEIYAEDVKCTHGATIGQLDNESLFYLLSRGIEKNEAHKILTRAFAEEIYNKIEDTVIRQYMQKRMSDHD